MMAKPDPSALEAQLIPPSPETAAAAATAAAPAADATEYSTSLASKVAHLAVYFLCNLSLTLYNKMILGKFAYPWLLTALHAASSSIGCCGLRTLGYRDGGGGGKLSLRHEVVLLAFSSLFTLNIAVSNISLAMVSIPFHQIMRCTLPVLTVLLYRLRYGRRYSTRTYLSLVPIVAGVALATYGDYYFTAAGCVLTLLGVVLSLVKTVTTNRIMTGPLALSPLESLIRLSPLACVQALACAYLSGELSGFAQSRPDALLLLALAGNGLLAFVLNVSSFSTNRAAGALTMTVSANVKQCLTILLGIAAFGLRVGFLNGLGMAVALAGAAWYSAVELRAKGAR